MHAARQGPAARFQLPGPITPGAQFEIASGRTVRPLTTLRVRRRDARTILCLTKHGQCFEEFIRDDVNEVCQEARAPPRTRWRFQCPPRNPPSSEPQATSQASVLETPVCFCGKLRTKTSVREPVFNSSIHGVNCTETTYWRRNSGLETHGWGAVEVLARFDPTVSYGRGVGPCSRYLIITSIATY